MLVFILRRLAQAVVVMLTVAFIAFMLFQYVGDPVNNLLGQDATPEQREQLRKDLGLDQSFIVQFAHFAGNAAQGEFGVSLKQGRKVSALIAERFPATLELSVVLEPQRDLSTPPGPARKFALDLRERFFGFTVEDLRPIVADLRQIESGDHLVR